MEAICESVCCYCYKKNSSLIKELYWKPSENTTKDRLIEITELKFRIGKYKDERSTVIETHCNRIVKSRLFICKFALNSFISWLQIWYLEYFDNRMNFRWSDFFRRKQELIKYIYIKCAQRASFAVFSHYKLCGG